MTILLTGGGTGGHVNPALAIAATVREKHPDAKIYFAASALPSDKAGDLVPRAGYELYKVNIRGLRRPVFHPVNLRLPFVMLRARREAKAIIEEVKPDLIVGTGGYACWPLVSQGIAMGIPTAVHESNALPGKAIQKVKGSADRILVNFPETAERLGLSLGDGRTVRVGNPHMPGFATIDRREARARLGLSDKEIYILSFGGSLGAEHVNEAVVALCEDVVLNDSHIKLLHATGKRDADNANALLSKSRAAACDRVTFTSYIYDMPVQMAAADLVISRAGAMSISELALMGKAAVLVPSPYVAEQHQLKNAMALVRKEAGVCVEEHTLATGGLTAAVKALLDDPARRAAMGKNIRTHFACPDANEAIYRELMALLKQ